MSAAVRAKARANMHINTISTYDTIFGTTISAEYLRISILTISRKSSKVAVRILQPDISDKFLQEH